MGRAHHAALRARGRDGRLRKTPGGRAGLLRSPVVLRLLDAQVWRAGAPLSLRAPLQDLRGPEDAAARGRAAVLRGDQHRHRRRGRLWALCHLQNKGGQSDMVR
eukprot:4951639-Prymnesium_polylepis.1